MVFGQTFYNIILKCCFYILFKKTSVHSMKLQVSHGFPSLKQHTLSGILSVAVERIIVL